MGNSHEQDRLKMYVAPAQGWEHDAVALSRWMLGWLKKMEATKVPIHKAVTTVMRFARLKGASQQVMESAMMLLALEAEAEDAFVQASEAPAASGQAAFDVRQNYRKGMDTDPVQLARWIIGWFHRYEQAGKSEGEASEAVGAVLSTRQIDPDVMAQAMSLVELDGEADALFLSLGDPPVSE